MDETTTQPDETSSQLVVIGSSAGGIEALRTLVSSLPQDFPAPIVIAQHLDPERVSHLQEILSRFSKLPVETVGRYTPLRPGIVYVVPASQNVEVTDHALGLRAPVGTGPRPSVDLLLSSAAAVFGERLVAVILTGTGSDGADGAWHVKQAGGTVVIQDPRTASFPGMPLALAPTTVDVIVELEAMGQLLYELLMGTFAPPTVDEVRRMEVLLEQLRSASGIDFSVYRQPTIQRRLRRRMLDVGMDRLEDYLRYLRSHPDEYQRLASSFLIKVTDFFRDPDLFEYLRAEILPQLISRARQESAELRIWSAGCATGEEPYSIAILLAELLREDLDRLKVRIFATDLDGEAITFARHGFYPPAALNLLTLEQRERYFLPLEGGYEVKKYLRRLVVFGQHDLGQRSPFPRIDLVLCRNVLIYFTSELQRRALQLFAFALKPGGRLILGKSETSSPLGDYFVLENPRLKIYRRQDNRILIPPSHIRDATPQPVTTPRIRPSLADREARLAMGQRLGPPTRPPSVLAESAFQNLPVGLVIIDDHYDIQTINAAARRLLEIHTPAIGEDLIHLADRLPAVRLREAIDRAFRGQATTERFDVRSLSTRPGSVLQLEVSCHPQESRVAGGPVDLVAVLINDLTSSQEEAAVPRVEDAQREAARGLVQRLTSLAPRIADPDVRAVLDEACLIVESLVARVDQLSEHLREVDTARRELLDANQELTIADEELRRQNEELLVAQEEAEAAAEEVETLNEEQQATNEELETLNEELQATVEELNTTNDDLEARQQELQHLAASLDAERSRLEAILSGMADAVLVVDRSGNRLLTNAAFDTLFAGLDLVAADDRGTPLSQEQTPQYRAARGETFRMQFTAVTSDRSRHRFEATSQPARTSDDQGIIVIRDIGNR